MHDPEFVNFHIGVRASRHIKDGGSDIDRDYPVAPYCGTDMAAPVDFDTSCATPDGGDILCNIVVSDKSAQGCATDGSQICDARWPLGKDLEVTREWYGRPGIRDPGYKCRDGPTDAGCGESCGGSKNGVCHAGYSCSRYWKQLPGMYQCFKLCCTDADCGSGTCYGIDNVNTSLGACVTF